MNKSAEYTVIWFLLAVLVIFIITFFYGSLGWKP